jgi:hypothetical protein
VAHPFFDALQFPWNRAEAGPFLDALVAVIPDQKQIRVAYQASSLRKLPSLNVNQTPEAVWTDALENLVIKGALKMFAQQILPRSPIDDFRNAIQAVINAVPAIERRIFPNNLLVLDRQDLRKMIESLEPPESPIRVLLVRGSPKSGKSYTRHLFLAAARDHGAEAVYLHGGSAPTVQVLIANLFSPFSAIKKIPKTKDTTDPAWYSTVCLALQEVAAKARQTLWIAVDDLGVGPDGKTPLIDTNVRAFCETFASNMGNPAFNQFFRLMLIHYPDGEPPTKWLQDFWTECQLSDADINLDHVVEMLRTWSIENRPEKQIVEQELRELAGDILAKSQMPEPPGQPVKPRLQRINDELVKAMKQPVP